jgi:hypothetical protein
MPVPVIQYNAGAGEGNGPDSHWWEHEDPSPAIVMVCRHIEADQFQRRQRDLIHASLYANQPLDSLYQLGVMKTASGWSPQLGIGSKFTWNVIQVIVDSAAAKISKNRPRPLFLTSGGDWFKQRQAKGLSKFTEGLFEAANTYPEGQRSFIDGCVFDAGIMKVYADDAEIKSQRVLPAEVLVDDTESIYGQPRSMYQKVFAHRDLLIEAFGDKKSEDGRKLIDKIKAANAVDPSNQWGASDMVQTYEAWHLGIGGKAGRHCIAIDGTTLFEEEYRKDYFPFAWFRWNQRLVGMWGQGLAEQLVGIQLEIRKLLQRIQEAIHKMAVPRIYHEVNGVLNKATYTNEVGIFVPYSGKEPVERVAQAMSAEVYEHLERLYAKAFEIARLSQMSAIGQKPAGLDAAVALREFHDIENEGFVVVGQRYEQMFTWTSRRSWSTRRAISTRARTSGSRRPGRAARGDRLARRQPQGRRVHDARLPGVVAADDAGRTAAEGPGDDAGGAHRQGDGHVAAGLPGPRRRRVSLQTAGLEDVKRTIENIVEHAPTTTRPSPPRTSPCCSSMAQSAYLKGRNDKLQRQAAGAALAPHGRDEGDHAAGRAGRRAACDPAAAMPRP